MDTSLTAGSELVREAVTELGNTALKILRHRELAAKAADAEPQLRAEFSGQLESLRQVVLGTSSSARQTNIERAAAMLPGTSREISARSGLSPQQVHTALANLAAAGRAVPPARRGGTWAPASNQEATP